MDTRLLKMFCAVAESGSLVTASTKLHLTPSAISHAIKSLETQLGVRLFERAAKKMLLNQAGEQLLASVGAPLAALDAAAESLRHLGKWGRTRLRIGAPASICQHLLPSVFRELKKLRPQTELQVQAADTLELIEALRANHVDVAIGIASGAQMNLQARALFRDELMFAFSPAHPWATGASISRDDLRTQPMILYQPRSVTAQMVQEFFSNLAVVPSTVIEIGNMEAIKELLKVNLGVSVLAPWTAERELCSSALLMRPVSAKPLLRRWVMFFLPGRRLSLAEEDICKLCRRQATGLRLDRKDIPAKR